MVAPLVGAWIEISRKEYQDANGASLLSWERGLKSGLGGKSLGFNLVAPLVGAWIEIMARDISTTTALCRSSRGSVD